MVERVNNQDLSLYEKALSREDVYWPKKEDLVTGTETIYKTPIDGLYMILDKVNEDSRGTFRMVHRGSEVEKVLGHPFEVAQVNLSQSKEGVARGFHAEMEWKLIMVPAGKVICVLVDVLKDSPTCGKSVKILLGNDIDYGMGQVEAAILVKPRIANSFQVLKGVAEEGKVPMASYVYQVSVEYANLSKEEQVPLSLFNKQVGMDWLTGLTPEEMLERGLISKRDLLATGLTEDGLPNGALEWDDFIKFREEKGLW